jgi:predicted Zn finger-like uncharacterized protein
MRTPTLTSGDDFICPRCGAQYFVSYARLPIADSGSVYCDVCRAANDAAEIFPETIPQTREATRPKRPEARRLPVAILAS